MNLTLLTFQRYSIYHSSKVFDDYHKPGDGQMLLYTRTRVNHNSPVVVKNNKLERRDRKWTSTHK